MILQTRDRELLTALSKYGILSTRLVNQFCFKNLHHTTLMRRLRILETADLIIRTDALPNSMCAWSLGAMGAKTIGIDIPARYANRNTITHDVYVSEVRLALESMGLGQNFTSERELKRQAGWQMSHGRTEQVQIPDGLLIEQESKTLLPKVISLEVELHAKSIQRYARIVREYLQTPELNYVWYVVKNQAITKVICTELSKQKRYESSPDFLFCSLDKLFANPHQADVLFASTNQTKRIDEIFNLPRLEEKYEPVPDHPLGRKQEFEVGGLQ